MATFTTTNPTAKGNPTLKSDVDTLRDNNLRLLEQFEAQHYFHGAGSRGGRHKALYYYRGNDSVPINTTSSWGVNSSAFATGNWRILAYFGRFVAVWNWMGEQGDFDEYAVYTEGDLSGYAKLTGAGGAKYAGAIAAPYIRLVWTQAAPDFTLYFANDGSGAREAAYVIWRVSQ